MNSITFNQDNSCISVSTDKHQKIYNSEPFGEIYSDELPTSFIKILFSTSLTIIIPKIKDNRTLKIHNLKQKLKICELIFPSTIIDVKLNKKRLIVILKIGQLYIYDLSCVKLIKIIELNSKLDKKFIGDLLNDDNSLLVLPINYFTEESEIFKNYEIAKLIKFDKVENFKFDSGWILIYDTIEFKPKIIMKCHSSNLKKIKISKLLIATASVKGTIIRVFHLTNDLNLFKIQNLRRGRNLAKINVLVFNKDNSILGCGSESTIHFFKLSNEDLEHQEDSNDNENNKNSNNSNNSNNDANDTNDINDNDNDNDNDDDETLPSDDSTDDGNKLSGDLNENLANLLISKPVEEQDKSYFSILNKKLINSTTKKIIKQLPYKDYLNNLILEPPKRSFSYIKLKSKNNQVEIGFLDDFILVVSYSGTYFQYKFQDGECQLVNKFDLE